jgi:hypothetical protein
MVVRAGLGGVRTYRSLACFLVLYASSSMALLCVGDSFAPFLPGALNVPVVAMILFALLLRVAFVFLLPALVAYRVVLAARDFRPRGSSAD